LKNTGVEDGVWGGGLPREFVKFACKNSAFSCNIFTCFKMHPLYRRGRGATTPHPTPLNPPLGNII